MSEEAELRECGEAFESEEGDVEPDLEDGESGRELLERLRELEAENSALVLANESQREAYERCLDEVANHVVQALLNQKDLREECIKLKMRVFDLERQNRTLTELFHQKLHCQPSLQQMPLVSFPEHSAGPPPIGQDKPAAVQSDGQAKSGGDRTRNGTTGTPAPPSSMEALSPFFKKKAHILEVLRKLEESDPLKFPPSTGLPSYPDLGPVLVPEEVPLARSSASPPPPPPPRCRHSCSDSDLHEHVNGEGAPLREAPGLEREGCPSCLPLTRKSLESVLKCGREPARHAADWTAPADWTTPADRPCVRTAPEEHKDRKPAGAVTQPCAHANLGPPLAGSPTLEEPKSISPQEDKRSDVTDLPLSTKYTGTVADQSLSPAEHLEEAAEATNVEDGSFTATSRAPVTGSSQVVYSGQDGEDQVCNGLCFPSNETPVSGKAVEKNATETEPSTAGKSKLSPTSPSCIDEMKASPISSPSRLLKFLKIPSIGERAQATNPLRLSPQLTRSSKIPCRNNNYEVYHSPVLARKATTTERDRQPPSSKADPYPATHSAPTSPPKPEDAGSPIAREVSYSCHSAPKSSRGAKLTPSSQAQRGLQKVPHYENVSDLSTSCPMEGAPPQFLDPLKGPHFLPYPESEDPIDRHTSLLEEKSLDSLSPPTADPPCAQDQESAVWYKLHHSLPSSSASLKAQSNPNYSSMRDKQHDRGAPDTTQQGSEPVQSQAIIKRSDPPSVPKKPTAGKSPGESSHHPFKERLAALGKLKSSEDLPVGPMPVDRKDMQCVSKVTSSSSEKSKTAERQGDRGEHRHSKYTDSLDGKPYPKANLGSYAVKFPGPCAPYEPGAKSSTSGSTVPKAEQAEAFPPRVYVAKAEGTKYKIGLPSTTPDPPQVLRNYIKCTTAQNLPSNSKTAPSPQSSPTKVPSKSPSKPGQAPSGARGPKPLQDERASSAQKPSPRAEDKGKLTAGKKKNYGENLPPPPPRPPEAGEEKKPYPPCPQSAIEQKVMKGIEENLLKLQEQDRGQAAEVKQKASNGIASWFGLRKSKLPALSRKPESKLKLNMSSAAKDPKAATKKKLEVESLNISKLMEKAEDLRKALEEERAYVNGVALDRPGRGHSCEVVMDQAQGQLSVMYRGVASDNFMQQLLNRVDERDPASFGLAHRRLSFDSKKSRPVISYQRNGISHARSREEMGKGSDLVGKEDIASDERLAESMGSQHFAGSGASMRTLDSGIGTFPLPDYVIGAAGKSIPKARPQGEQESASHGKPGPVTKVPRKARTLERELSSLEEVNPSALYAASLEGRGLLSSTIHEDVDAYGAHMRSPPSKNWTFPNLKASTGPAEMYLGVKGEVEPAAQGSPFRQSLKPCVPMAPREVEPPGLALPPQMGLSRRGKGRTPSASEVGKEGGLELVKERPDDIISPSRPQALETPESLSDSLYDSLSSCGSQG
ncbi:nck-associated protein 5-like [Conger conger]|uniref:nck-associated protein 5-like n=1 Tax=Conger conger TaxID=82655 RepID=UPI002A5A8857|nr:nck-associated protein 5-like [Conger conger]XP_061075607.1 nck-associated protein 5-like [Conger conger]XP_061075608.1 nck-associated protein 5-like [Conger conger]XP_061075609.1 nck-associated protein 5-like [Conger conger]XP_061075610.1 nck-associated protein 5-like [Conger conger]